MIPFTLFLLLISPLTSASLDLFYFHTSITCRYQEQPEYTYSIRFIEEDTSDVVNEYLTEWSKKEVIKGGEVDYQTFKGQMNGDWLGDEYEIYAEIEHDCIPGGYRTRTKLTFIGGTCVEDRGDCHLHIPIDLTDLYIPTEIKVRFEQSG